MTKPSKSRHGSTLVAAFVGGVAAFGLGTAGEAFFTADARQPIEIQAPRGAPISFADLIEQVSPAVVSVNVTTETPIGTGQSIEDLLEQFRGRNGQDEESDEEERTRRGFGLGSGFFISADGYIVTNNHVIDEATEIEVVLTDGRELKAELVGADPETDLAVIRVTEGDGPFPFVEFSDNVNVRVGDWVVAVGNPFGLGGTATAGIVSAKGRRDQPGRSSSYVDFLQVDASINRGNSGGPTFDLNGQVIGVNTAILSPSGGSVGIGFAIPADVASMITQRLIDEGRVTRGWLGVTIQSLSEEMAEALELPNDRGAIVSDLVTGGPADTSGLERGDIILGLNGRAVLDSVDLTRQVAGLIAGTTNDFRILRDGKEQLIKVTVDERPTDPSALQDTPPEGDRPENDEEVAEDAPLGVTLQALSRAELTALGLAEDEEGVLITKLDRSGILAERGLRPGMVILGVNYDEVGSVSAYADAVEQARTAGRKNVVLSVLSEGRTLFLTAPLSDDE